MKLYLITFVGDLHHIKKTKMKCIKLIVLIAAVSFGFVSCSMGGGHTRCAAYSINDSADEVLDDAKEIESKEYKETELIY